MTHDLDDDDLLADLRESDIRALRDITRTTFTCNQCHTSGSATWMTEHDCRHNQQVDEFGGRCEDFPCCGHTDGDGCRAQESHTSAFWARQMRDLADRGYDEHEIDMMMDRDH